MRVSEHARVYTHARLQTTRARVLTVGGSLAQPAQHQHAAVGTQNPTCRVRARNASTTTTTEWTKQAR